MTVRLAAAILLITTGTAAASVIDAPDEPLWFIWRGTVNAGDGVAILHAPHGPSWSFAYAYLPDGKFIGGAYDVAGSLGGRAAVSLGPSEAAVDVPSPVGSRQTRAWFVGGEGVGVGFVEPGDYVVVAGAAGAIHDARAHFDQGRLVHRDTNFRWAGSDEFDHEGVHAGVALSGGTQANLRRTFAWEAAGNVVGAFAPASWSGVQVGSAWVDGPDGERSCPCMPYDLVAPGGWGPGSYTLHLDELRASAEEGPLASWVEVPFPFPQ